MTHKGHYYSVCGLHMGGMHSPPPQAKNAVHPPNHRLTAGLSRGSKCGGENGVRIRSWARPEATRHGGGSQEEGLLGRVVRGSPKTWKPERQARVGTTK